MILPTELRLGNILNAEDDFLCMSCNVKIRSVSEREVNWISITESNKGHVQNDNIIDLEPIPLTTEILLKCGFTERTPDSENVNSWRLKDTNVILNQYKSDTSYWYLYPALWYPTRHIKYLHEVQNITFYLTEFELEIIL